MNYKILKESEYQTSHWTGGETNQIFIYPEKSSLAERDFLFRLSSATCPEEESPFTKFEGYKRYISPLDNTLVLDHEGNHVELEPYDIYYFDGSDKMSSKSSVRDFNLILKDGLQGSMRKESFKKEKEIDFMSNLKLVFTYESDLEVEIDEELISLQVFETLLIGEETKKIKLKSNGEKAIDLIIVELDI